jgi:hypothetical protein
VVVFVQAASDTGEVADEIPHGVLTKSRWGRKSRGVSGGAVWGLCNRKLGVAERSVMVKDGGVARLMLRIQSSTGVLLDFHGAWWSDFFNSTTSFHPLAGSRFFEF